MSLEGESELALATQALEQLPEHSLLILDRLYGQGPFVEALSAACAARASHFLVRVRGKLRVEKTSALADGSAWVEVRVCAPQKPRRVLRTELVREVRARVWNRRQEQWSEVRLWTSLGPEQASAEALVALYARRWEQEIFLQGTQDPTARQRPAARPDPGERRPGNPGLAGRRRTAGRRATGRRRARRPSPRRHRSRPHRAGARADCPQRAARAPPALLRAQSAATQQEMAPHAHALLRHLADKGRTPADCLKALGLALPCRCETTKLRP